MAEIKTRFAPSPTGHLHVGNARTALFSFLVARHAGGKFLVRIEDTDRARHDESAVEKIADDLRWLGMDWDEGVGVGGPDGPYRQSERLDLYKGYLDRLLAEGKAYHAFDSADELDEMRKAAEARKEAFRYARPDELPDAAQAEEARAAGRDVVVRFLCEARDVTIRDEAFGDVTWPGDQMDDFIIAKGDGWPTYHLANVIDDALMGVNFILRGQEFLAQTWRHVLLREAMGFSEPRYCHLPLIMDMQGRKLSKRDGDVEVHAFRAAGYLPETMVNFLALLGWRPGGNREKLTMAELIDAFGVDRVGKSNARFDRDKLAAFNTDALAEASEDRLLAAFKDYLSLNETPIPAGDDGLLRKILRATRGVRTLADIPAKCGVLFAADDSYEYDEKAVQKVLVKGEGAGGKALAEVRDALVGLDDWSPEGVEAFLEGYCAQAGLGMGKVAQPIRVAVTGGTISPAIQDTLAILGRAHTLARIDRCLAKCGQD
jgi:glutamyl-tRNA synthetase